MPLEGRGRGPKKLDLVSIAPTLLGRRKKGVVLLHIETTVDVLVKGE